MLIFKIIIKNVKKKSAFAVAINIMCVIEINLLSFFNYIYIYRICECFYSHFSILVNII